MTKLERQVKIIDSYKKSTKQEPDWIIRANKLFNITLMIRALDTIEEIRLDLHE